jgi:hypothetical protein
MFTSSSLSLRGVYTSVFKIVVALCICASTVCMFTCSLVHVFIYTPQYILRSVDKLQLYSACFSYVLTHRLMHACKCAYDAHTLYVHQYCGCVAHASPLCLRSDSYLSVLVHVHVLYILMYEYIQNVTVTTDSLMFVVKCAHTITYMCLCMYMHSIHFRIHQYCNHVAHAPHMCLHINLRMSITVHVCNILSYTNTTSTTCKIWELRGIEQSIRPASRITYSAQGGALTDVCAVDGTHSLATASTNGR